MKNLKASWNALSVGMRFVISFVGALVLFYIGYYSNIYEQWIMPGLLNFQASISSAVLNLIGYKTTAVGDALADEQFSVSIKGGCDGVEATALYVIAILALPIISLKEKLPGLGIGLAILFVLNIVRIAGLFIAGKYAPGLFEFLHLHGGVVIFTMISVIMWLIWVNRILNKRKKAEA